MTNEEAVKMLRTMQRTVYLGNRKFEDAIECAIKALSEPLQPQEAIAKLKAYEEKQKAEDEIRIGDEVETKDRKRFVVTTFGSGFDGDIAVGVCADGLGLGVDLKELHKTGRHFDIASILEDMRHD